jgi:hypothetical protein
MRAISGNDVWKQWRGRKKENPGYLESTYQYARNQVAYDWK